MPADALPMWIPCAGLARALAPFIAAPILLSSDSLWMPEFVEIARDDGAVLGGTAR